MEKHYDISRLLDFYGEMLSDRQRLAANLYYNDDLSLSEVAEELGISRQGVRASLARSEEQLHKLEDTLGLAAKFDRTIEGFSILREYARETMEQSEKDGDERLMTFARKVAEMTLQIENSIENSIENDIEN